MGDSNPEDRSSKVMWFIIGITSFASPVTLWFFRRQLLKAEDDDPGGQGGAGNDEDCDGSSCSFSCELKCLGRRPRRLRDDAESGCNATDDPEHELRHSPAGKASPPPRPIGKEIEKQPFNAC